MRRVAGFCLLLLLSACSPSKPDHPDAARGVTLPVLRSPTKVSDAEVAAFKGLAEEACRCERKSPDDGTCWDTFTVRTQPFRDPGRASAATACAPVSTQMECFNQDAPDGGFCIVTGYELVGAERTLCNEREAQIVEATFTRTLKATGDDYARANAAATRAADALIRGEPLSVPDAETGCTG